jgi:hypothetical protein
MLSTMLSFVLTFHPARGLITISNRFYFNRLLLFSARELYAVGTAANRLTAVLISKDAPPCWARRFPGADMGKRIHAEDIPEVRDFLRSAVKIVDHADDHGAHRAV